MAPGLVANPSMAEQPVPVTSTAAETTPPSQVESNDEEKQYLDLVRDILEGGEHRPDRTGTGTYSLFAPRQLRFTLSRFEAGQTEPTLILPLLTTKRVFLRGVIAELLWFVAGDTSSKTLSDQDVHIWDGNSSRAYLDSVGLTHREEGDLGPVYGFQWRHFGAEYTDAHTDYTGQGVDQLAEIVRKLKESPFDRRIILSAWNPAAMSKMALPPCHVFAQFYVSYPSKTRTRGSRTNTANGATANGANNGALNTRSPATERGVLHSVLYQRSCDMGLGIPFNIVSYALLTHMLAHVCDLVPGTFTHTMGDAHVYLDHVEALEVQLTREPRAFPTLEISRPKGDGLKGLEEWKADEFAIKDYRPHKATIPKMKMSV